MRQSPAISHFEIPMKKSRNLKIEGFMSAAADEARKGMNRNEGGPFGAVVVRDNRVIARAHNRVIKTNDPTAHAEVLAIRAASRALGRFDLSDCVIVSTCEPCPMCLAAIYWAKIRRLYYGCSNKDAARIGFDDRYIYQVLNGHIKKPRLKAVQAGRDSCLPLFRAWSAKKDKVRY
jgi:guanine deaminase